MERVKGFRVLTYTTMGEEALNCGLEECYMATAKERRVFRMLFKIKRGNMECAFFIRWRSVQHLYGHKAMEQHVTELRQEFRRTMEKNGARYRDDFTVEVV